MIMKSVIYTSMLLEHDANSLSFFRTEILRRPIVKSIISSNLIFLWTTFHQENLMETPRKKSK